MESFKMDTRTRNVCGYCRGRGTYQSIGEETCMSCCGTGRSGGMIINIPDDKWYCMSCNGSGKKVYTRNEQCHMCGGSGYSNY